VNGSFVRIKDVARVELGAQTYAQNSRVNGKPAAVLGLYHCPGPRNSGGGGSAETHGGTETALSPGLEYDVALDTTAAVTEGIHDIYRLCSKHDPGDCRRVHLFAGVAGRLDSAAAVPVSWWEPSWCSRSSVFSVNTLSLLGLVLAIGLVVDDAIVVVEAVEHHIEHGLSPREATLKAMDEVSGPVIAIALILAAFLFRPPSYRNNRRCTNSSRLPSRYP